jgi:hypothetical protein
MIDALILIAIGLAFLAFEIFTEFAFKRIRQYNRLARRERLRTTKKRPTIYLQSVPPNSIYSPTVIMSAMLRTPCGKFATISLSAHDRQALREAMDHFFPAWSPTPVAQEIPDMMPGALKVFLPGNSPCGAPVEKPNHEPPNHQTPNS